ncbi:comF operon protein ComFC [Lentibacillus halophilus]|uniref:ComF operon protein ComFC n=1 Tax=Lentibacillus halophilus TaxID=295065 RepID=A0ABN0ZGH2_9BACI
MNCLWCDEHIVPSITWKTVLTLTEPMSLCASCEHTLVALTGERCVKCSRMSEETVCKDCRRWENDWQNGADPLAWNVSVFQYNEAMREMIARWKYRGDYCLGDVFQHPYQQAFRKHFSFLSRNAVIVPIPLSDDRLKDRGFNQAARLADSLPRKTRSVLMRTHGEKQSKKTKWERISGRNPFKVTESITNPVVLTDDIYTTGTTLRHAAFVLKQNGSPSVYAMTLIRG